MTFIVAIMLAAVAAGIDIFNTHLSLPTTFSREFWFEPRRMGWGPNQVVAASCARAR